MPFNFFLNPAGIPGLPPAQVWPPSAAAMFSIELQVYTSLQNVSFPFWKSVSTHPVPPSVDSKIVACQMVRAAGLRGDPWIRFVPHNLPATATQPPAETGAGGPGMRLSYFLGWCAQNGI